MDKILKVVGKTILAIIIIVLLAPWAVSEVFHIRKVFTPPEGKIYAMENSTGHHVLTFSDDRMFMYNYNDSDNPFSIPSIVGIKMELKYRALEYYGIGAVHFPDHPSIFIWKNYIFYEKNERNRLVVDLKVDKVISVNASLLEKVDRESVATTEMSIFDDYILLDGEKYMLITDENNTPHYEIYCFDKYGEEIKE